MLPERRERGAGDGWGRLDSGESKRRRRDGCGGGGGSWRDVGQPYANGSGVRANQEGRLPLQRSELPLNHEEERARERDGECGSDSEPEECESEGRSEREARETGRTR